MNLSKHPERATISMLRAFVCLSKTLSLTRACEELGATRQTVRRHINDLEALTGQVFFQLVDRRYKLTRDGIEALENAEDLLLQIDNWSGRSKLKTKVSGGLEAKEFTDNDGNVFLSQQHPVSSIAKTGLPILRQSLRAWGAAATDIDHEAMEVIRPYSVVYRQSRDGWVFVEIGDQTAYTKWFGRAWSRSAIGKLLHEDEVGDEYNQFISGAYSRISEAGGVRLDHIFAHLPKNDDVNEGELVPVTFQRLLMGCAFPDGTPALSMVAVLTNEVEIDALNTTLKPQLSDDLAMDQLLSAA